MRSHVEFRSAALIDPSPATGGGMVAGILKDNLPLHGFEVVAVTQEDWGVHIALTNDAFALSIGCGHYAEYPDGHLCFIEPSKPVIRRWLRKISTVETVEKLAAALDDILAQRNGIDHLRWWTEAEVTGQPD